MVSDKLIVGIKVFYARNRPQRINLVRQLVVGECPTYLLVNKLRIIGYKAPAPSQTPFVQWAIHQGVQNAPLSQSYLSLLHREAKAMDFVKRLPVYSDR